MPKHTQVDLINDPVQRAAEMSKLQLEAAIELLRSGPKKNPLRESLGEFGITMKDFREAIDHGSYNFPRA